MNKLNKKFLLGCSEFWLGIVSLGLIAAIVQILWYPLFLNPNPEGIMTLCTNHFGELWFDVFLVFIVLCLTVFSVVYIFIYRFWLENRK